MLNRWARLFDSNYNFARVAAMEFIIYWLAWGAVAALLLYNMVSLASPSGAGSFALLNIIGCTVALAWLLRSARELFISMTFMAGNDDKALSKVMLRHMVWASLTAGGSAVPGYFWLLDGPLAGLTPLASGIAAPVLALCVIGGLLLGFAMAAAWFVVFPDHSPPPHPQD